MCCVRMSSCCLVAICFMPFALCYVIIDCCIFLNLFVCFLVLKVLLSILGVLRFCIFLCIVSPHIYIVGYFSFLYKFTDHCHRMATQLQ